MNNYLKILTLEKQILEQSDNSHWAKLIDKDIEDWKTNQSTKNKKSSEENFEFGIDSRYQSKKEKGMDSIQLMNARLERLKSLSDEEIIRAKLMQLKLQMENYPD